MQLARDGRLVSIRKRLKNSESIQTLQLGFGSSLARRLLDMPVHKRRNPKFLKNPNHDHRERHDQDAFGEDFAKFHLTLPPAAEPALQGWRSL
jgi:hypothetical protein